MIHFCLFLHRNTTLDYHHLKGAHAKSWSIPTNFPQELWLAGQFLCSKQPLNETSYFPVIDVISKCVPSCDIGNPALDFKGQDTCGVYIWISSLGPWALFNTIVDLFNLISLLTSQANKSYYWEIRIHGSIYLWSKGSVLFFWRNIRPICTKWVRIYVEKKEKDVYFTCICCLYTCPLENFNRSFDWSWLEK